MGPFLWFVNWSKVASYATVVSWLAVFVIAMFIVLHLIHPAPCTPQMHCTLHLHHSPRP